MPVRPAKSPSPAQRRLVHRTLGICAALLLLFAILAGTAAAGKSPTADESYHALAGWLHLWQDDYRFDTEDPPLWDTLAALATGPHTIRASFVGQDWVNLPMDTRDEYLWQIDTLFRTPGNDADAFIERFRLVMLAVAVGLGAMIGWSAWRMERAGEQGSAACAEGEARQETGAPRKGEVAQPASARRDIGPAVAAIVATGLFALDPNFLAHGGLMKNDVASALAMAGLVLTVWAMGRRLTVLRVAMLGLWAGVAIGTKFTGPLLVAIAAAIVLLRAVLPWPWVMPKGRQMQRRGGRVGVAAIALLLAGAIAWGVLWISYGMHYLPGRQPWSHLNLEPAIELCKLRTWQAHHTDGYTLPDPTVGQMEDATQPPVVAATLLANSFHLLPQSFVAGLLYTYQSSLVRGEFLCGQVRCIGWWWYFPFAIAVKTPLATLAALAAAAAVGIVCGLRSCTRHPSVSAVTPSPGTPGEGGGEGDFERRTILGIPNHPHPSPFAGSRQFRSLLPDYRERGPDELPWPWTMLCLLLPVVLYLAAVMASNLNLGLRHVLPIYPLLYIAVGLAAARLWRWRRTVAVVAGLAIALGLAIETLAAYPNFIPFFNALAGGSRGGIRLLSDSNLDWGQDLPLLARWQRAHPQVRLYLAYFGTADPAYYGIHYINLEEGYWDGPPMQHASLPGVIAISATTLQGPYTRRINNLPYYAGMWKLRPFDVLGGSIYLFHFPPGPDDRQPPGKLLIGKPHERWAAPAAANVQGSPTPRG